MPLLILFIIIALVLKSVFWALVMLFVIGVTYMFQTKTEQVVIQPSDCNKKPSDSPSTVLQYRCCPSPAASSDDPPSMSYHPENHAKHTEFFFYAASPYNEDESDHF